jgi:hypothetical protein
MLFQQGVKEEYFEWLYNYVCKGRSHSKVSYRKLLECLHQIEFTFFVPNDVNRAKDGVDLRYRFAMVEDDERITDILDGPCTVLEMMVALSIRCEETIMDDTQYGDRTGQWFWNMMSNLGIGNMPDDIFDREIVEDAIYRFLERRYDPDGKGGLFHIRGCSDDLRNVEIWVQLCWYLDNY